MYDSFSNDDKTSNLLTSVDKIKVQLFSLATTIGMKPANDLVEHSNQLNEEATKVFQKNNAQVKKPMRLKLGEGCAVGGCSCDRFGFGESD